MGLTTEGQGLGGGDEPHLRVFFYRKEGGGGFAVF